MLHAINGIDDDLPENNLIVGLYYFEMPLWKNYLSTEYYFEV